MRRRAYRLRRHFFKPRAIVMAVTKLGGDSLPFYGSAVFTLSFFVHFLLLFGINQLFEGGVSWLKQIIAAVLSGIYSSICIRPQFYALGNPVLRIMCLVVVGVLGFGCTCSSIRKIAVFTSLCLIMDIVSRSNERSEWSMLIAAVLGMVICALGNNHGFISRNYIPVELSYGNTHLTLTALQDTGNHLRDPLTGKPVLVVDAVAAQKLTGLTQQQLRSPVETLGAIPGLRLIPYKVIGGSGFLLALSIPKVRIGIWQGRHVVAFAPDIFQGTQRYQALTGGIQ